MLIMFKEDDYTIKVVDNNNFLDVGFIRWADDWGEWSMDFNTVVGNATALLEVVDLLDWMGDNPDIIKRHGY